MFSSKNQKCSSGSSSISIGSDWWNKINNSLTFDSSKSSSSVLAKRRRQRETAAAANQRVQQAGRESYHSTTSTYSTSFSSLSNLTQKLRRHSIETPRSSSRGSSSSGSSCSTSGSIRSGSRSDSDSRGSYSKSLTAAAAAAANKYGISNKQNNSTSRFNIIDYLNLPSKISNLTRSSTSKPAAVAVAIAAKRHRYNTPILDTTINTRLTAQTSSSSSLSRKLNHSFRLGSSEKKKDFRSSCSISSFGNSSRYYTTVKAATPTTTRNNHRLGRFEGRRRSRKSDDSSSSSSANLVQQFKQEMNRLLKGFTKDL